VVNYGRHLLIEANDTLMPAVTRGRRLRPVCGDHVRWLASDNGQAVIEEILPRHGELLRHDPRQGHRILAANVDILLLVMAIRPEPDTALLDRYLVAGEALGLELHLVFNKADLLDESQKKYWQQVLAPYCANGYTLHWTAAKRAEGLQELLNCLSGNCGILLGQSGVGKSSLIKALVPDHAPRTQALSQASGQGQHTTTATRLYRLPVENGGSIIDSPGVRDFRLWNLAQAELAQCFREFRPLLGQCRFSNCRHLQEPGCAVTAAVKEGRVNSSRYASYKQLAELML